MPPRHASVLLPQKGMRGAGGIFSAKIGSIPLLRTAAGVVFPASAANTTGKRAFPASSPAIRGLRRAAFSRTRRAAPPGMAAWRFCRERIGQIPATSLRARGGCLLHAVAAASLIYICVWAEGGAVRAAGTRRPPHRCKPLIMLALSCLKKTLRRSLRDLRRENSCAPQRKCISSADKNIFLRGGSGDGQNRTGRPGVASPLNISP